MRKFKLFSLFGFDISIDLSWFLILGLVIWSLASGLFPSLYPDLSVTTYWVMGTVAALLLFLSVLVHELSHSLMARKHGLEIGGIRLFIFGGVSEMTEEPEDPKAEFRIAIVGPITSVIIAGIFYLLTLLPVEQWSTPTAAILSYLAILNLALAIFNIVPGFPLDGGRVLRAILWGKFENIKKATDIASKVGKVIAFLLIAFGAMTAFAGNIVGGIWYIFIGMFLNMAAESGVRQVVMRQALQGVKVSEVMSRDVVTVSPDLDAQSLVDEYIMKYRFDMFPVVDETGELVGLVELDDVKDVSQDQWSETNVEKIMDPVEEDSVLHPDDEAVDCLNSMIRTREQGRMPVIDDENELVGVVTRKDIMNLLKIKTDLGN
jgi:Zn-dependent protease